MKRDFLSWNSKKEKIDSRNNKAIFFHERDVWWCSLGLNVGNEQDGKGENFHRPVIVIKKFSRSLFWAIPLTTKLKKGIFYLTIDFGGIAQAAILSQMRMLDSKRLINRLGVISEADFQKIKQAIKEFL